MFAARLTPASRLAPSSVFRNSSSASTRLDDQREVVLAAEREHGVDQVVARALVAEEDFETVGEEGEEVIVGRIELRDLISSSCSP